MTNKKTISIVLGIMCFALTVGICVQVRTVRNTNSPVSQNYEENNLRDEVLRSKEKYDNRYKELEKSEAELEKIREKAAENNEELEKAENQIKEANKINGLTEVKGAGVIITLDDGKDTLMSMINPSAAIVHDTDIVSVVNELKNAGAEAISVNDQRIVPTSGIMCGGNVIAINGERVGAPFVIKAIGLPEYLAGLERPGGILDHLKSMFGVKAELERSNNVTIPKYSGVFNFKYMKNVQ